MAQTTSQFGDPKRWGRFGSPPANFKRSCLTFQACFRIIGVCLNQLSDFFLGFANEGKCSSGAVPQGGAFGEGWKRCADGENMFKVTQMNSLTWISAIRILKSSTKKHKILYAISMLVLCLSGACRGGRGTSITWSVYTCNAIVTSAGLGPCD